MNNGNRDTVPFRFEVIKKYPQRGPLHQYRLAVATAFTCGRCGQRKTSKLTVAVHDHWDFLLCNGCYGRLLSIWEIKAGDLDDTKRHSELVQCLGELVAGADVALARTALHARESRMSFLSQSALTMLATAEAVAERFTANSITELDWSAAIIGLCKAVELELGRLVAQPLQRVATGLDLAMDLADRDFRRMAQFCSGGRPLELGTLAHFMSTISQSPRSATSPLAAATRSLGRGWPRSDWLFASDGCAAEVQSLVRQYRNPAAHTALLSEDDYRSCADIVLGDDGILWKLLSAVDPIDQ